MRLFLKQQPSITLLVPTRTTPRGHFSSVCFLLWFYRRQRLRIVRLLSLPVSDCYFLTRIFYAVMRSAESRRSSERVNYLTLLLKREEVSYVSPGSLGSACTARCRRGDNDTQLGRCLPFCVGSARLPFFSRGGSGFAFFVACPTGLSFTVECVSLKRGRGREGEGEGAHGEGGSLRSMHARAEDAVH